MTARRPLIGLTGRRKSAASIVGTPESLRGLEGDWYYADYARGVMEAGGLPVHLPLDADPRWFDGYLDGIVLSGGADVDPLHYGAQPDPETVGVEPERDDFELRLVGMAIESETPVLGVCRGLQILNVATGGSLHQHVPDHARYDVGPDRLVHEVDFVAGSELARIYGPRADVNSLHHQTVDRLGDGWTVTAHDPTDGTVEGFEHERLPIIAIQWHPEMLATRGSDPAFAWIVDAAARYAATRHADR